MKRFMFYSLGKPAIIKQGNQNFTVDTAKKIHILIACIVSGFATKKMEQCGLALFVEPDGQAKMILIWSKAVKGYRLKNVYEPKTFKFRTELMESILEAAKAPVSSTAPRVSTKYTH